MPTRGAHPDRLRQLEQLASRGRSPRPSRPVMASVDRGDGMTLTAIGRSSRRGARRSITAGSHGREEGRVRVTIGLV
jgi:hypothetical protein